MEHRPLEPVIGRRRLISAVGAVAASGVLLSPAVSQDNNPAAQVEDRGSAIRISALTALSAGTKAYLKIETSQKVTGWGEVTGLDPAVACALARSLFELLDGENPTRIEHLWQKLYRSHRDMRGGPFMTHVISAIDMALWDITGKLYGVPVYRLLGGPCRDRIRVYTTPKAVKVSAGGPKPWSGTPGEVQGLVDRVAEARKRVGPDGTVMFDAHCCLPPPLLIQFAAAIQPYDVLWIEEPAVPGNIEVFKRIKAAVRVPIATGERDRTIWEMLPYLHERCVDILQPDCGHTGGISQMKKIAALAEAYNVPLAPHCTMSELGLSASIHAVASIPNFLIQEAYLDGHIMPPGVARKNWDVDKDGYASLPQGPGLGVEMDEAMIAKVDADPKRKYKWPLPKMPDGSNTDY
ncbi:MAG TPA: mandelate racemase/muconate lactonizing enzyme family protein [Planctomycetota bacterium]|nr:mandelate racemase/muconate lactonizing enzyme family protein [Planctomycetota bacterium]